MTLNTFITESYMYKFTFKVIVSYCISVSLPIIHKVCASNV